jgi:hypothetical protein
MKMSEPRTSAVGGRNKRIDRGVGIRHPLPSDPPSGFAGGAADCSCTPSNSSFSRFCAARRASEMGHVWTAPAVQEESDSQRNVRVQSCIRPVKCGRFDRGPNNAFSSSNSLIRSPARNVRRSTLVIHHPQKSPAASHSIPIGVVLCLFPRHRGAHRCGDHGELSVNDLFACPFIQRDIRDDTEGGVENLVFDATCNACRQYKRLNQRVARFSRLHNGSGTTSDAYTEKRVISRIGREIRSPRPFPSLKD